MNLEFRIAISPRPQFYSVVRLAALSLRSLGPPYDSARVRVSVGDYADLDTIRATNRWAEDFPLEWRNVCHDSFSRYSYLATSDDRFLSPSDADVIVVCDSDFCLVDRIDDILDRVAKRGRRRVAGLQAHFSPFSRDGSKNEAEWRRIFAGAGLDEPNLVARYSGDSADVMGRAPPYFNYGFVAFSHDAFAAVAPLNQHYNHLARELTDDSFFMAQVGLSLSTVAAALEIDFVSFAYNCSNDELPFTAPAQYAINSVNDIRAIHYLRGDQFDRRIFLVEPAAYAAFMSAENLNPVNMRLREHISKLSRHEDLLFRQ